MKTVRSFVIGKRSSSRQERIEDRVTWFYIAWMLMLFLLKCIFEFNVPSAIFLISGAAFVATGPKERMLTAVISCVPFSVGFQYRYLILICIAIYLLLHRQPLQKNAFIIVFLLFVWEGAHILFGHFSPVEWLRDFAVMLFLMITISMDLRTFSYRRIIRVLAIATVGICIIMLWMQLAHNNYRVLSMLYSGKSFFRFGTQNMDADRFAVNFNPNGLGMICNVSTCGLLILYKRAEHNKLDLVCLIVLVMCGCMTLSKTYYVVLTQIILMTLFIDGKKHFLRNIKILLSFVFVLLLIGWLLPEIFDSIWRRLTQTNTFSNRDVLMIFYLKHSISSISNFLFGIGLQNLGDKIFDIYGYYYEVPHNFILEIWCVWGLVGIILMGYLFYLMLRRSKNIAGSGRGAYQFLPFIVLISSAMAGQLVTAGRNMMLLIFAYLCMCIPAESKDTPVRTPAEIREEASPS